MNRINLPKLIDVRDNLTTHPVKEYRTRDMQSIKSIAIHHSLTQTGSAESFARYHVKTNGWPGIGYHFVIEKDGFIKWCHDLNLKTYHVGNSNGEAVGVCLTGDFSKHEPTASQEKSLSVLLKWLLNTCSLLPKDVKGHSEYPGYANKACPCLDMELVRERLKPVKKKATYLELKQRGLSKTSQGYVLNDIISRMEKKAYKVFKHDYKAYNLNLIGIRSQSREANTFDDFIGYFYRYEGQWQFKLYKATTDPGLYYLNQPLNKKGTAILKANQYRSAFTLGLHRGRYKALKQMAPLTVYRDSNRDELLDCRGKEETGLFGINIHRASAYRESQLVNRWSAGCQLIANPGDYNEFISLCTKAAANWGPEFTYTLLED